MQKTITGVLIDPEKGIAEKRTLAKDLSAYYETLRCTCIDIVNRSICGKRFDIICDDEGLLTADQWLSAIDDLGSPMLVGPLFVVQFDGMDDVTDLTDEEIAYVLRHVTRDAMTTAHPEPHPLLTAVSY